MKKEYTSPKIEVLKIGSEENIAVFFSSNYNIANLKLASDASNVISY
ncbi:MAG: hypothetical protein LIO44_01695 [Eubacterium sp.]|nr:hypothetical protein [Eubacterium sp.]